MYIYIYISLKDSLVSSVRFFIVWLFVGWSIGSWLIVCMSLDHNILEMIVLPCYMIITSSHINSSLGMVPAVSPHKRRRCSVPTVPVAKWPQPHHRSSTIPSPRSVHPTLFLHDLTGRYLSEVKVFPPRADGSSTAPHLYNVPPGSCPFLDPNRPRRAPLPPVKRRIYCECCGYTFRGSLERHCESKDHRRFVADDRNYADLRAYLRVMRSERLANCPGVPRCVRLCLCYPLV